MKKKKIDNGKNMDKSLTKKLIKENSKVNT